jgi:hypothetical protein
MSRPLLAMLLLLLLFLLLRLAWKAYRAREASSGVPPLFDLLPANVAGIESIQLNGRWWYFGFADDFVMSPLMDDIDAMAAYAAKHLRQVQGPIDASAWRVIAEQSRADSHLASLEERVIDLAGLHAALARLRAGPGPVPELVDAGHLHYLLMSNTGDQDFPDPPPPLHDALVRLGLESDDPSGSFQLGVEILDGTRALPEGASLQDAARCVLWLWDALIDLQQWDWAITLGLRTGKRKQRGQV